MALCSLLLPEKVAFLTSIAPLLSLQRLWVLFNHVHMVMKRSCKVMETEICIPGPENSWKLEKFVWVMEKLWNFQIFPKSF